MVQSRITIGEVFGLENSFRLYLKYDINELFHDSIVSTSKSKPSPAVVLYLYLEVILHLNFKSHAPLLSFYFKIYIFSGSVFLFGYTSLLTTVIQLQIACTLINLFYSLL